MFVFWPVPSAQLKTSRKDANLLELERRMAEFLAFKPSAETLELVQRQREAIRAELETSMKKSNPNNAQPGAIQRN